MGKIFAIVGYLFGAFLIAIVGGGWWGAIAFLVIVGLINIFVWLGKHPGYSIRKNIEVFFKTFWMSTDEANEYIDNENFNAAKLRISMTLNIEDKEQRRRLLNYYAARDAYKPGDFRTNAYLQDYEFYTKFLMITQKDIDSAYKGIEAEKKRWSINEQQAIEDIMKTYKAYVSNHGGYTYRSRIDDWKVISVLYDIFLERNFIPSCKDVELIVNELKIWKELPDHERNNYVGCDNREYINNLYNSTYHKKHYNKLQQR